MIELQTGVIGLTDFARNTKEHSAELHETNRPKVLTHNGKASLVVMSVEAYEEMASAARERELDIRLRKTMKDYANGDRGQPIDEVFDELRDYLLNG